MSDDRQLEGSDGGEGIAASIGRLMLGATVTFFTWKILQYVVGDKLDARIDARSGKPNSSS